MKKLGFIAALFILASCGNNNAENTEMETPQPVAEKNDPVTEIVTPATKPKPAAPKPAAESHTAKPDNAAESKVLAMIMGLPEISKKGNELSKQTNGKRKLRAMVSARPSDDAEYYTVAVGEDDELRFDPLYIFHVYPDNSVMAYDPVKDEEITMKKWKKTL